ncbi:unnamed protein product [Adineta ricciae]|uniref:Uncharacterized protein n=1 Tax=Adineta ricciae TaxID=249248 RepID=A0A815LIC1_ADIRI|nr:unnamed protein product [Adineta ricciae]
MATAAYSTHPDNAYAGFGSEADPYNTNNPGIVLLFDIFLHSYLCSAGTYDTGFGPIASNDYEYPPDAYDNDYPNGQQQQPFYTNDYQQAPHTNEDYDTRQPQHNPMNTYNQQPQNGYPNAYTQPPQNGYPNSYNQQPQANPPNTHGQQSQNTYPNPYAQQPPAHNQYQQQPYHQSKQQQQSLYPNEYGQPPYSNGQHPMQQTQDIPPNAHPQQQQQQQQQQPYYPNQYDQSPYDNEDYPPQQPPNHVGQQQLPPPPPSHSQQHQQPQQFNSFPNQQAHQMHQRPVLNNSDHNDGFNDMNPMQPPYNQHTNNQYADSRSHQQTFVANTQRHPSSPVDQQSRPHFSQSEHLPNNRPPKQDQPPSQQQRYNPPPPSPPESDHQISKPRISVASIHRPSVVNDTTNYQFEPIAKPNNSRQETKNSKTNDLRDQTHKTKADTRDNKSNGTKSKSQNASSQTEIRSDSDKVKQNKKQPPTKKNRDNDSLSDDDRRDRDKSNRNKKPSKSHKNHRDNYRSDDDYSSDENDGCRRCRSRKQTTYSDTHLDRNTRLPPLRRLGKSSQYDSRPDHRSPAKLTSQRRFSQFDDSLSFGLQSSRRSRHQMGRDASNHRAPRRDAPESLYDRDQRNGKPRRNQTDQKRSTDRRDHGRRDDHKTQRSQLGPLRSTRNDRKHRGTCDKCGRSSPESDDYSSVLEGRGRIRPNEIPFSHPPIRSDTYVETERIRAVRDAQGYYIPYKPYTLKEYNQLKKSLLSNPYSKPDQPPPTDRKELVKKGQEYGTFIEKQVIDSFEPRQSLLKENQPVKPWHGGISTLPDPEDAAKRERAIEYAKIQVRKYQEIGTTRTRSHKSAPDHYAVKPLPRMNEWNKRTNQVPNDDDDDDDDD